MMHPNIAPVTNKYLAQKLFLKTQADHEKKIKNARSVVDRTEPTPRPHCSQRLRQKQIREYESSMIEKENKRFLQKIIKNGSYVDTHNHYVLHHLKTKNRPYEQVQHENELQRLQKRISEIRPTYSIQEYQQDYGKNQDIKKRMSRFSLNNK